jgi:diguanylate cyclase (GGDEF)-like protein
MNTITKTAQDVRPVPSNGFPSTEMGRMASCGQWSFDRHSRRFFLDDVAAEFLRLSRERAADLDGLFSHVIPDDVPLLQPFLDGTNASEFDHAFRVVFPDEGVRWMRMRSCASLSSAETLVGVLVDVTEIKRGELREQILFASTQYLIGFSSLEQAVRSVIKLVCEGLGWEWGAYWSCRRDPFGNQMLACAYEWHADEARLTAFTADSRSLRMAPGHGLVGRTWFSGEPAWIQDVADDASFLRRQTARQCGLHAGFAFPVAFVAESGERFSPGVLEFYSSTPGKRDCQLPRLSAAIGAFIAQSAHQHVQNAHIRQIMQIDQMTGVASRGHFLGLLDRVCAQAQAGETRVLLLYVHLHRLQQVSEAFGHDSGADYLGEFGRRLQSVLPPECTIGRLLGGDFAVIVPPEVAEIQSADSLVVPVMEAGARPFRIGTRTMSTSASVGLAAFPTNADSSRALLQAAHGAMQGGRHGTTNKSRLSIAEQLTMEAELQSAIGNNELYLEYQPIFDGDSGRMAAVEALVRWRRSNGETVRPDVFIPLAEECGLIAAIDSWVAAHAIRDLAHLRALGLEKLQININMSAEDFMNPALPNRLMCLAIEHEVPAERICLELTERSVMRSPERVIGVLARLRELGFKISIDDFGTGHSSLARIMDLPITSIKIDRSFIKGLPKDGKNGPIVRTILDLGRYTRLRVVAEGVETEGQRLYLEQFGCRYFQGYHFSRPVTLDMLASRYGQRKTE